MDPERDASDAIACFHIMREKPLPTWTWRELKEWTGVRRQRLRELRRARGLPPEARSVEVADIECERYVLQGRTSLWNLEVFVGPPDPRIEHVMRRGMLGGAKVVVPPDVLAREREELGVRGLFGMEAWCAATFDGAGIDDVRAAWRARWLAVDDALGPDGIVRCTLLPPHFAPASSEAIARAAELMAAEARPPPPPPPADTSRTVPAETPV